MIEILLEILRNINEGKVDKSNQSEVNQKLKLLEKMVKILEKQEGKNENTEFLKKLLVSTNLHIHKLISNSSMSTSKSGGEFESSINTVMNPPQLPSISQFKPKGSSNIFSPYIDIKTSSPQDNKRFLDAYEKGFEKGYGERTDLQLGDINIDRRDSFDFSTKTGDVSTIADSFKNENVDIGNKNINMGVDIDSVSRTNTRIGDEVSLIDASKTTINGNESRNNNKKRNETNETNETNESENGYIKGNNNGKLGMPGYSYIDPQLWDMPKKRHPVCINRPDGERKPSSLLPSGYMTSGDADFMEFTGVGSILPTFSYKENKEYIDDNLKKI